MTPSVYHHAVLGVNPPMKDISRLQNAGLGVFTGGFVDRWDWNQGAVYALTNEAAKILYDDLTRDE